MVWAVGFSRQPPVIMLHEESRPDNLQPYTAGSFFLPRLNCGPLGVVIDIITHAFSRNP